MLALIKGTVFSLPPPQVRSLLLLWKAFGQIWVAVSMLHVPTRSYPDCPKNKTEAPDRLLYQLTSFFFFPHGNTGYLLGNNGLPLEALIIAPQPNNTGHWNWQLQTLKTVSIKSYPGCVALAEIESVSKTWRNTWEKNCSWNTTVDSNITTPCCL